MHSRCEYQWNAIYHTPKILVKNKCQCNRCPVLRLSTLGQTQALCGHRYMQAELAFWASNCQTDCPAFTSSTCCKV